MRALSALVALALTQQSVYAVPNFVVILADDLGYNDLGSYGSPTINTKYLDKMRNEGMKFTQFYTAASVCSPSRSAMLQGRLAIRDGCYTNTSYPLDMIFRVFYPSSSGCMLPNAPTIAEILRPAGYYNSLIGKWHTGHRKGCGPTERGFHEFFGLPYSHEEGFPGSGPESIVWPPVPLLNGTTIVQQPVDLLSLTEQYTQLALNMIDAHRVPSPQRGAGPRSGQPFFLHLAYEHPHVPLFVSPAFAGRSRRGLYGDAVEEMDDSIGRVLRKLEETGLAENTLVLFASDNGAWLNPNSGIPGSPGNPLHGGSNAPFRDGKGSTWEGGFRSPALAWWPGTIAAGSTSMEIASLMDLLPTFLSLAKIAPTPGVTLDGKNLAPLLLGRNTTSPHEFFYFWRENTLMAVRWRQYKLHFSTRSGFEADPPVTHSPPLLFDLEQDPGESFAIANSSDVYKRVAPVLAAEAVRHRATIAATAAPSQYEPQDWALIPCCRGAFDPDKWSEHIRDGKWDLALWELVGCTCNQTSSVVSLAAPTHHRTAPFGATL